jgi:exodeoxyribonuclease X
MHTIFLDTETTGNDLKKDRLCQVCYKHDGDFYTEYFKPTLPISIKAMSITHITNEDVEKKPLFKRSPYEEKLQALLNDNILVAHNAAFDVAMLKNEDMTVPKYICTLKLVRYLDEEGEIPEYNQQFLRYYFKLKFDVDIVPHDAEGDVRVLEGIFNELKERFIKKYGEDGMLEKMIEISTKPVMVRTFLFGKHKGEPVDQIAVRDKGYLEWLYKAKKENPDGEEDWLYTLEHYLGK